MNSELVESLVNVIEEQFTDLNNVLYVETALEALSLIYQVGFL
jgi:hypothetical protein